MGGIKSDFGLDLEEILDRDRFDYVIRTIEANTAIEIELCYFCNLSDPDKVIRILEALKNNTSITTLGFSSTCITDDGAKHIADFLQHDKRIVTLNLSKNAITNVGARLLLDALKQNAETKLSTLLLEDSNISPAILQAINATIAARFDIDHMATHRSYRLI